MNPTKTIEQLKKEYEAAELEYEMCDASNDWDRLRAVRDQKKQAYNSALLTQAQSDIQCILIHSLSLLIRINTSLMQMSINTY